MKKSDFKELQKGMKTTARHIEFKGSEAALCNGHFIVKLPLHAYKMLDANQFPAFPLEDGTYSYSHISDEWEALPQGVKVFDMLDDFKKNLTDSATVTRLLIEGREGLKSRVLYGGNDEVTILLNEYYFEAAYPFTGAKNVFCNLKNGKKSAIYMRGNVLNENMLPVYEAIILPINYKPEVLKEDLTLAA